MLSRTPLLYAAFASLLAACSSTPDADSGTCPIPGADPVDELILEGEVHFKHLWRLTYDGENAEAYWNPAGDRLVFQRRYEGVDCDRIFATAADDGEVVQVSNGHGTTTCSYFLPDGKSVLYGSTHGEHDTCPPKPDHSLGYVWPCYPEYEVYTQDLATGEERLLAGGPGYDAEATVSPLGDRVVFTSTRSGDIELWTCAIDGSDVQQVTDTLGYDGGAFFSHDGEWLVFRTTQFDADDLEASQQHYRDLLAQDLVKPGDMELMVIRPDGTDRQQVTNLGNANWAPYFYPDDSRIIFCSNHTWTRRGAPVFNLFAVDIDGSNLEQITYGDQFESFPMFSPDGRYLVFSSNRAGVSPTDTNLYIAEWQ
jgi:TolB protein